jgi:predicted NAD/FAD-binding protein
MPEDERTRVVIIGAGAAGVFTAYLLDRFAEGRFEVTLIDENAQVGGHAHSMGVPADDPQMNIDLGAQFFSEEAQPAYCRLLRHAGFFDVPGLITSHDVGMTVWHKTRSELVFRIPNSLGKIFGAAVASPRTWLCFVMFVRHANEFFKENDWSTTFGDWLDSLNLSVFVAAKAEDEFKRNVVRPLMYQFGLVAPDRLDDLSARFVLFYFLGSLPQKLDPTPLSVYNCSKGLDWILDRLVTRCGAHTHFVASTKVESISPSDNGGWRVTTNGANRKTCETDVVVVSTNPRLARQLLPDDADHAALRAELGAMPYTDVLVRIQHPDPSYMPDDEGEWSVSNVLVVDEDEDGAPDHYMLTVWFGAVRDHALGRTYFKSWGSPSLHPPCAPTDRDHTHQLMVGTPAFIEARTRLCRDHQSNRGLWFVGGYLVDYDTQNSAFASARDVAEQLARQVGVIVPSDLLQGFMRTDQIDALRSGLPAESDHVFPERFALIDAIEEEILRERPDDETVQAWMRLTR